MRSVNGKFATENLNLDQRASGVLLHVTSLPGKYGIGDLGPVAHQWIDMLAAANQRWWQMLPLGPCGEGNSPYRSYSAFAGNPLLVSPDSLVKDGLLNLENLRGQSLPPGKVDYQQVTRNKMKLLGIAHDQFRRSASRRLKADFAEFIQAQSSWLDDFALFMSLRETHPEKSWTQWPKPLLRRHPSAIAEARLELITQIDFHKFAQFIFYRQLQSLRAHARAAGVALIGDLPIFVSPESVDVWTNPKLFQLDAHLRPRAVAGVPPDLFSSTGQCWGNPLYNWTEMKKDHFAWWKTRLKSALGQADLVRIDHFRGFQAYWRIPVNSPTAQTGRWVKAPGFELFQALLENDSRLPLLAEDLGIITPEVELLRDRFNLPGMRVLQFGFDDEQGNPHTPHNFIPHCFAYTGTHDNDTSAGWYRSLPSSTKRRLQQYAPGLDWHANPAWSLIRLLMASVANQAIVPMQDLLSLGSNSRMNRPGSSSDNWQWRLESLQSCKPPLSNFSKLTRLYNRIANHGFNERPSHARN
jgi:4-alpha-glucanotransferase